MVRQPVTVNGVTRWKDAEEQLPEQKPQSPRE